MATAVQRAKAILDALSDGNLSNQEMRDVVEEFINAVGVGGSSEAISEEFLTQLGNLLRRRVRYNGEKRKKAELAPEVNAAGSASEDKIPSGVPKSKSNGPTNKTTPK